MKKVFGLIVILLGFILLGKVSAASIPPYANYVTDTANVILGSRESALNEKLKAYDDKTTNQIAVLTVSTTAPDSIEEYAIDVAQGWGVGQKGTDNGILMVFAMNDRKMRIEVGRGLEGEVTDLEANHIINDTIVPLFKQGKIEDGIEQGINGVMLAIDSVEATQAATTDGSSSKALGIAVITLIVVVLILVIAFSPYTPFGGEGDTHLRGVWVPKKGSEWGDISIGTIEREYHVPLPSIPFSSSSHNDDDDDSGGSSFGGGGLTIGGGSFGGFGGGSFSGGGSSGSW